jgi:hypothetical protein
MGEKGQAYVMSINFDKDKHKELIEWIKKEAEEEDRSISSLCITALKFFRKQREGE